MSDEQLKARADEWLLTWRIIANSEDPNGLSRSETREYARLRREAQMYVAGFEACMRLAVAS